VIVVDDGSTDKTYDVVSSIEDIGLIKLPYNQGKRFAFATGVENSKGDILICVDSDTLVESDAIKLLVQPFKDENVFCICGHGDVLNKNDNTLTQLQRAWYVDGFRILKAMERKFNKSPLSSYFLDSKFHVIFSRQNSKCMHDERLRFKSHTFSKNKLIVLRGDKNEK